MSILMWLGKIKSRQDLCRVGWVNKGIRETFVREEKVKAVCQGSCAMPGINISLELQGGQITYLSPSANLIKRSSQLQSYKFRRIPSSGLFQILLWFLPFITAIQNWGAKVIWKSHSAEFHCTVHIQHLMIHIWQLLIEQSKISTDISWDFDVHCHHLPHC